MSSREDVNAFFELESFDQLLGDKADEPRVAKGHGGSIYVGDFGFDDDPWVAKMCHRDASQFLSSIKKSSRLSRSRNRPKEDLRKPGCDDSRDDNEGYLSIIPLVIHTGTFTRNNNNRDKEFITGKEKEGGQLDPPSASTKFILDDLTDLKAKIMNTFVDKGLEPEGSTIRFEASLSTLLLECEWERAIQCVRLHPEEAGQEIKASNGNLEYRRDINSTFPLHLACSFRPLPPTELLQELIHAYPEACQQFEEPSGMLPIHIAANLKPSMQTQYEECKPESPNHSTVIDLLLSANPESICAREKVNGMTPLHIAASTTRAENGIVSTSASNVLGTLVAKSPTDAVLT